MKHLNDQKAGLACNAICQYHKFTFKRYSDCTSLTQARKHAVQTQLIFQFIYGHLDYSQVFGCFGNISRNIPPDFHSFSKMISENLAASQNKIAIRMSVFSH